MKKVLFLMLALSTSAASFAHTNPGDNAVSPIKATVYATKTQKVKLALEQTSGKAQVMLRTESGKMLHNQSVNLKNGGQLLSFDVSALEAGVYEFTITAGTQTITKAFVIETRPAERTIEV